MKAERIHKILKEERDLAISQAVDYLRGSCPWPKGIWTMTEDEYVLAVPDSKLRTAISGFLMRSGWECAVHKLEDFKE